MENLVSDFGRKVNRVIGIYQKSTILRYGIMLIYLMLWFFLSGKNVWLTVAAAVGLILGWMSVAQLPKSKTS